MKNSKNRLKKINTNNYNKKIENVNDDNNNNCETDEKLSEQERKYREYSSKLIPKENVKNLNDSLNSDKDKELEKENNKNLNEISDMMKDILENN